MLYIYITDMTCTDSSMLIIIVLLSLIGMFYIFNSSPIQNHGSLAYDNEDNQYYNGGDSDDDSNDSSNNQSDDQSGDESSDQSNDQSMDQSMDSSISNILLRSRGRNNADNLRSTGGKYKRSSYKDINSGEGNFGNSFDIYDTSANMTDNFMPSADDGMPDASPVPQTKNRKDTENDKYNVNSFLPQEENKDWFETVDVVKVKNRHLINLYRPIGVNTVGSSHRNSSYDLRGDGKAICPKFVVSPWLQSTIEPDRNTKTLC